MTDPKAKPPSMPEVESYLAELQDRISSALEEIDGGSFDRSTLVNERGGESHPQVLSDGEVLERAAVIRTHARGDAIPAPAVQRRPELRGHGFEACSLSVIVHPRNPFAPTAHANLRFFLARDSDQEDNTAQPPIWWFGGGFDLTPYYGFVEDAEHWHRTALKACAPFGEGVYPKLKKACDDYFYLPHREEPRGIGGIFFEDLEGFRSESDFATCFAFVKTVGDHFQKAYLPILDRRRDLPYTERQREFQLYRRGRYAEFNLAFDRGTRYGLAAGVRAESLLASLPPQVVWKYDWQPETGSEEERLYKEFLVARDWIGPR